ncbi:uncharacterized protein [Blastocystis hominis]|uniref:BRCT domain-containing protein n=1 Tax=Blastocystis hominis TaxID=12968 RepID=D8M2X2_BLAHO|nr:uncharacterized protein [Blastocystis hominis]CBK22695.2 unnamed protein product [Blastocystis hominis]|eukprot:XP_012896743.1 uncharacterized protein [Blastocystis hominis]
MTVSLQNLPSPAGEGYELEEAFAESEEARELLRKQREAKQRTNLFAGKVFFLAREVPRGMLEFVLRSFGGKVGWEGPHSPLSPADPAITHVIVDRPAPAQGLQSPRGDREFVQPQWVLDCVNNNLIIPADRYAPGKTLPPHLSPFVDNQAEGWKRGNRVTGRYTPEYQKEIDAMKRSAEGTEGTAGTEGTQGDDEEGNRGNGETEKPEDVGRFAREIEREEIGEEEKPREAEEEKPVETEEPEKQEKQEKQEEKKAKKEEEEKERRLLMAKKKHQRIYRQLEQEEKKKEKRVKELKSKAEKAKKQKEGM